MTTTTFEPTETDLGAILQEVWASFLGDEAVVLPGGLGEPADGERVTALVSITGAWDGHVVAELSATSAARVAAAFLQVEPEAVEDSDVADAVGELVNMVGGFIKSLAPSPSALSLPLVLCGRNSRATAPDTVPVCRADVIWHDEAVAVTVLALAPTTP